MKVFAVAFVVGLAAAAAPAPIVSNVVCKCCKDDTGCVLADVKTVAQFNTCTKDITCDATAMVTIATETPCVLAKILGAEIHQDFFPILDNMKVNVTSAALLVTDITGVVPADCDAKKFTEDVAKPPTTCAELAVPTVTNPSDPFTFDATLNILTAGLKAFPHAGLPEIVLGMTEVSGKTGCKLTAAAPTGSVVFAVHKVVPGTDSASSMIAMGAVSLAAASAFLL